MKILFLVYHGFSEVSGISKKIHYQVKGLRENGYEVHILAITILIVGGIVVVLLMTRSLRIMEKGC